MKRISLPVVAEYGLGVIPYFSLAGGFLTGKYRSEADAQGKARAGMVGKYLNARGFAVLDALDEVAEEYKSTPASVALAWLIAQPGIAAPIASATNEKQLADLVAAAELKLDARRSGKAVGRQCRAVASDRRSTLDARANRVLPRNDLMRNLDSSIGHVPVGVPLHAEAPDFHRKMLQPAGSCASRFYGHSSLRA